MQKNSAQSADILLQFTNALAKPFPDALTDVANYVSSLSTNAIFGVPTLPTPPVPSLSISLIQVNSRPATYSQITIPSTPTRSRPPKNSPSSPIEESLPGFGIWRKLIVK